MIAALIWLSAGLISALTDRGRIHDIVHPDQVAPERVLWTLLSGPIPLIGWAWGMLCEGVWKVARG